jgi:hypothetical protein
VNLETPESVRQLQHSLQTKAKAQASYRFYSLYDKVWRRDVLSYAYELSRENDGAPGVDGQTFEQIEKTDKEAWLEDATCRGRWDGNLVRKPDAGQPPVRFDEREVETDA